MIGQGAVFTLLGATFAAFAVGGACDRTNPRRLVNALFWGLLATSFLLGGRLGDLGNGVLAVALVAAGTIGIGRGAPATLPVGARGAEAARLGDRLFLPALAVPAVALAGALLFRRLPVLVDPAQATPVALAAGVLAGLALAFALLRPAGGPGAAVAEGRRLGDAIGWALLLPPMLAALGALFAAAGVGAEVGRLLGLALPGGSLLAAVLAYGLGMALLTAMMGNAFAAFPVMMAAVGLPLLVQAHGGRPAAVAALGMLAGFCGTLLTPLAANFNLVPVALLDLPGRWAVIRVQAPTALVMLAANLLLLWALAFR